MEGLSQIVWRAREGGFILGYNVGGKDGKRQEMSHLLHVDGTLVIYDTSKNNCNIWVGQSYGLRQYQAQKLI